MAQRHASLRFFIPPGHKPTALRLLRCLVQGAAVKTEPAPTAATEEGHVTVTRSGEQRQQRHARLRTLLLGGQLPPISSLPGDRRAPAVPPRASACMPPAEDSAHHLNRRSVRNTAPVPTLRPSMGYGRTSVGYGRTSVGSGGRSPEARSPGLGRHSQGSIGEAPRPAPASLIFKNSVIVCGWPMLPQQ